MPISETRWVFEHSHGLVENTYGQGFPRKEWKVWNLFPISSNFTMKTVTYNILNMKVALCISNYLIFEILTILVLKVARFQDIDCYQIQSITDMLCTPILKFCSFTLDIQCSFFKRTETWAISDFNFERFVHTWVGLGRVRGCQPRLSGHWGTMSKFSLKVTKISFRGKNF